MKKILITLASVLWMALPIATFATTFSANQLGASSTPGYILQTLNGINSYWVATSTLGLGGSGSGTVTSVTASSPLTGGTITTSGSLGCQTASGSQAGCLTSSDWTIFNNKQPSGSYLTSNTGDWAGTWQTHSPSYFQIAGSYLTNLLGGLNAILGLSTTTSATTTNLAITGLANTILAVNANGSVVATSTGVISLGGLTGAISTSSLGFYSSNNPNGYTSNTGTVTSVGLSSTNSTLTIGSTPVTTSGTITADINLANSNTWSANQYFGNASSSELTVGDTASVGTLIATSTATSSFAGNLSVTGTTTLSNDVKIGGNVVSYNGNNVYSVVSVPMKGFISTTSKATVTLFTYTPPVNGFFRIAYYIEYQTVTNTLQAQYITFDSSGNQVTWSGSLLGAGNSYQSANITFYSKAGHAIQFNMTDPTSSGTTFYNLYAVLTQDATF